MEGAGAAAAPPLGELDIDALPLATKRCRRFPDPVVRPSRHARPFPMTDMVESLVFEVEERKAGGRGYKVVQEIAGAVMGRVYSAVSFVRRPDGELVPEMGDHGEYLGPCLCLHVCAYYGRGIRDRNLDG